MLDGRRLRELRRQHGFSQDELASRAGISLATVGRLEQQAISPCRTRTLVRIAGALNEHPASIKAPG
jgi:transcriptional regulator with XRE-family HTH domain